MESDRALSFHVARFSVQLFAYSAVSAFEDNVRRKWNKVKEYLKLTWDASGSEIE